MRAGAARANEAVDDVPEPAMLGPYRLIEQLGEGGMGVVHLAVDPSGRAVAIKMLRPHIAHDEEARARLAREVQTLARVQDARVAMVLDADVDGDRPYIVTRYVPGPPLDKVVREQGPLQGEDLLQLGQGLSGALRAIHRAEVIHRDLKPANVLMLDGDPVVIDFGIAHVADDVRLTLTGLVMGTPGYLSPEVVEGAPVSEATDWWGWAATLAFAASGVPPFGRGPMQVVLDRVRRGDADLSGVDPRLTPLLRAALSPRAEERPGAGEVVDALERYAVGAPATVAVPLAEPTTPLRTAPTVADWAEPPVPWSPPEPVWAEAPPSFGPLRLPPDQDEQWGRGEPWEQEADEAQESDSQAAWDAAPGQPDPRIGRSARSGTLLAVLVALVGVASAWPVLALVIALVWSLLARFADRSVTSLVLRRHERGHRRSDVPLAVIASPWHIVTAALATVVAGALPLAVAVASAFCAALAVVAVTGGSPHPGTALTIGAGALIGVLMAWWGPAGASLRRGSRSLVRGVVRGQGPTTVVVAALCLLGGGLGVWAYLRHGAPSAWPWQPGRLPLASLLRRR